MRVREYDVVREAFERAFGFMLNRIWDTYDLPGEGSQDRGKAETAEALCWNEFMVALDSLGVEFENLEGNS